MSSEYYSEQAVSGSTKTLETLRNINELLGRIINFCDIIKENKNVETIKVKQQYLKNETIWKFK